MGLLNQVADEEIVLPAIQRDFVWSESQTAKLLDSVLRGYPIGLVLLWETYNDIQFRPFARDYKSGNLHAYRDNDGGRRIRVVLDGQQRMQSLYVALHGQREGRSVFLDVLSGQKGDDVEEEQFLFQFLTTEVASNKNSETEEAITPKDRRDHIPYWWLSVKDLFSMNARAKRELVRDVAARLDLTDEEGLLLDDNLGAFADVFTRDENILRVSTIDANLPNDSPYRKTEADVLEIFVRVNREGTALSRSDLIFSMLKLNWKESAEGLPEFVQAINNGNSFELDTDFVVRCLFAVSGLGGRLELNLLRRRSNVETLQENFDKCCDAIRATVDFVQNECKCQSSRLLGSSHTLVPIVYYFFHLPRHDVPNAEVDRLRTSLYLLALAKPFSRYAESRIGSFVRGELEPARANDGRSFPLERTVASVRHWERVDSLDSLAESNPELTLHLIQGLSGAKVQYSRNSPELDHIFPRAELRKKDYDEEEINGLANFWILAQGKNRNKSNRRPKEYFHDVGDRALEAALIDRSMLDYRRYTRFLRTRREAILARLEDRLGLGDEDFSKH
jgi:hypothetical protein